MCENVVVRFDFLNFITDTHKIKPEDSYVYVHDAGFYGMILYRNNGITEVIRYHRISQHEDQNDFELVNPRRISRAYRDDIVHRLSRSDSMTSARIATLLDLTSAHVDTIRSWVPPETQRLTRSGIIVLENTKNK